MAMADALKVNSSLTSLNLQTNSIHNEGAIAISAALKVNFSLISLNLHDNSIQLQGVIAITDALQENTSLTSLDLSQNGIGFHGLISIAKALTYNPTLLDLNGKYKLGSNPRFSGINNFKNTLHNLQGVLKILIGEDGAQLLGISYQIKTRCVTVV
jgi:Ran GTPase-activating protein (RanGAP) involved in mRNA processing and transport